MKWITTGFNRQWHWLQDGKQDRLAIRRDSDGWGIYDYNDTPAGKEPRVLGPFESLEAAKVAFVIVRDNYPTTL